MVGCDEFGAMNSKYVTLLDKKKLADFYTENNIDGGNLATNIPFWTGYQDSNDLAYLLAERRIEILPGNNIKIC